jgi:nicotinamide phosphoribosyltransferase
MNDISPLHLIDGYKIDHRRQYPEGTEFVYSNLTPRKFRIPVDRAVFFGLQAFVKNHLIEEWNRLFFNQPKEVVVSRYARRIKNYLGNSNISFEHIEALHDLGYLPIRIKALDEGSVVKANIPVLTITNTDPRFFWLTNYFETILSNAIWKPMTSATIARQYLKLLTEYAEITGSDPDMIQFQAHDFSFRGMSGVEDAVLSGAGHLTCFSGSDTLPAIDFLEACYNANSDIELVAMSVAATEHSVMCAGQPDGEFETFKRLITEIYPGLDKDFFEIVSIVSDTWDLWKVIGEFIPRLKGEILARNGKVVIRPDSGDPVKIIVGDPDYCEPENPWREALVRKGVVEALWDIFGGTFTNQGYKLLDFHIGAIYGDSITLERAKAILEGLRLKGFASINIVFGVGSYTYEYVTRDTLGIAMKATRVRINGKWSNIFKSPKTDDGTKNSHTGWLCVVHDENRDAAVIQDVPAIIENIGFLTPVFEDGRLLKDDTLAQIRERVKANI